MEDEGCGCEGMSWIGVSMFSGGRDERHKEVMLYELLFRELSVGPLELTTHSMASPCFSVAGGELV